MVTVLGLPTMHLIQFSVISHFDNHSPRTVRNAFDTNSISNFDNHSPMTISNAFDTISHFYNHNPTTIRNAFDTML